MKYWLALYNKLAQELTQRDLWFVAAEAWYTCRTLTKGADIVPSTVTLYPSIFTYNTCLRNTSYTLTLDVWQSHKKAKEPSKFQASIVILILSSNSREWESGLLAKWDRGKNTERSKICMKKKSAWNKMCIFFPIWLLLSPYHFGKVLVNKTVVFFLHSYCVRLILNFGETRLNID